MDSTEEFRKKLYDEIIIKQISRNNDPESARKCIETLLRIVKNIIEDPKDDKKRKLKEETNAFKKNIRGNKGGVEFLVRIGFRAKVISFEKHFIYELPPDNDPTEKIEQLKIAHDLLQDFLEKAQERAEIIGRMEAKEKFANEIQKKSVLESIEDDKIRRAEARKRSKETKELELQHQHQQKEGEQNQPKNENEEEEGEETTEYYRSYNPSHYRQQHIPKND